MQSQYTALSNHLMIKLNNTESNINEGLFDGKKGFLGMIGAFWTNFLGNGEKDKKNPLIEKMFKIAQDEAKDEEARLQKELKAEEDMEISKLEAEYQHNKKQMDIASQNRVKAYQAKKTQLDNLAKRAKENKLLYTPEQNDALIQQIKTAGNELKGEKSNPLKELSELAILIGVDNETGTARTKEEINEKIKNDTEFKSLVDRYNTIAKTHQKSIISAMDSDEFKEAFGKMQQTITPESKIEEGINRAEEDLKEFNSNVKKAEIVDKIRADYEHAKTEKDDAEKELNKITSEFDDLKENGNVSSEKLASKVNNIIATIPDGDDRFKNISKALSDLGLDNELITKITSPELNSDVTELFADNETLVNNNIDSVKEKFESRIEEKQSTLNAKKDALENTVNLDDDELSDEDKRKKIIEKYPKQDDNDIDAAEAFDFVQEQPKDDLPKYKKDSDEYKQTKTEFESRLSNAKKEKVANEKRKEQNIKAYQNAEASQQARHDNEIPEDIKDKVENLTGGIEAGEAIKDGKVGYYDKDGKFIEKPGPSDSKEKKDKYYADRDAHILTVDPNKLKQTDVKSVKKVDDKYVVTFKDGTSEETDADTAAEFKAEQIASTKAKSLVIERKQQLATAINNCIKDGKLDKAKFKELLNSDSVEGQANAEAIKSIMNSDDIEGELKKYFTGVDLDGEGHTVSEFKNALEKSKDSLKDEINNTDDENFDDDAEDVEHDEEDKEDDDNEYDSDEDETDEDGNSTGKKKKLKNPAKEWHRKKKKNGKGTTKSYYRKNGSEWESISQKEFKKKLKAYREAKRKATSTDNNSLKTYTSLTNYLLEKFN